MNPMPLDLIANLLSALAGLLVMGGCVLLWLRDKSSPWVLLALAGQGVAVLCRLLFFVPSIFTEFPLLRLIWPAAAMAFAIGLAGYAWTEYEAAQKRQGTQP